MTLCDVYCDVPGISLQSHYVGVLDMYGFITRLGTASTVDNKLTLTGVTDRRYCATNIL